MGSHRRTISEIVIAFLIGQTIAAATSTFRYYGEERDKVQYERRQSKDDPTTFLGTSDR